MAEKLDQQLLDSTKHFLNDRSRNRFDVESGALEVSSIFNWYAEDFAKGWRGYESLHGFFRTHADWLVDERQDSETLRGGKLRFQFLDYAWTLNSLR